ncbi:ataxin-7-like protein 2b isoform X2 [Siniperca chuatsi]|uniref:ataxin-7-like protein 2b isoform X2 n=1 Tax=Siniperca chuatsi TaxID=119488 RepID=UPI001CE161E6|nr:ataxin-7-like protein 2b isoform X2 [Siniperca chuatsi]
MAALHRRNPNLDDFVGLNWSCWVDRVNILPSDAGSNVEDSSKYGKNHSETMALRKEDMHIYGHCPAHDEIHLVVCSHCGQVVKPQAFEKHCERRHGPLTKMCGQSSTLAPQQRPRPGRPPSNLSSSRERQKDGSCHEASAPSSAALPVQHRLTKAQKEVLSFPSVEKFSQENPPLPHHSSSTPRPRVPPWHSGPLPPGRSSSSTSPSERPSVQRPTAGQSSDSHSPLQGMRTYSRIYKNIGKKECDLNKHCRILDPERTKLCTRELICNTDSIHQQQKALGKTKTFDHLAVEQRAASAGRDMEQLLVKSKEQHLEAFEEKITTQGSKYNLNSNCHFLRCKDPSESFPEEEGDSTVEVELQPPYPFNQSLLSSDESEDGVQEEATDLPATPWHPKPLGLCTFGCRTLGCSIFTFDRRWHHLRFALSAMLEHHVNTHLWKKMPQSSGLRSHHVIPPTVGSPIRTGARPSKSTGSLSLESTSLGQQETKSSQHNSHRTKSPTSTTSASRGPGRWRNPVVRPSKARLREVELMQDASAAQKAAKLSQSSEEKSSKYIRDPPLHEKGQPHVPSSQGPINGTFSHGKKPCPPLHRSPRSRGRPPGIQHKVAGYDHRGLAQKRKGSNESPPLSSSLSRTSKCQRLSSPSCSSLLAWKGESISDVLAWGLEKRSDS